MKNYFIIHGSFGNSNEHYLPWLKSKLENFGNEVIMPDFPIGIGNQNFVNWSSVLDKFKDKINSDTVFIGRSIAPIFIVKYLLNNNLKINALVSISGFNGLINNNEYDEVNKTFFIKDYFNFKNLASKRICFISDNDPYISKNMLIEFANNIDAKIIINEDAGHYNTESGYSTFDELLEILIKIDN